MVAANATGVLATYEEMYDFGIVEQGEGIHNRIRNLPATSQGKRSAMIEVNNGKGVFIRTGPASNIYEMTGARYSVGCGYLVATAGTDTKVEVAFGNFVSGGVAVGGEVVTHIFEGVVEGSLFRRRCTEQEAALADADWRLTKVRRDGTFHFELGMSDGVEGIVAAQRMSRHTRPRSSSASSTGRGCCRCRDPPLCRRRQQEPTSRGSSGGL